MPRGTVGEETLQPSVPADMAFPRKLTPRAEPQPAVGAGLEAIGNVVDQKLKGDAMTWASDQLTQARIQAHDLLTQMQQAAPAGDPGDFTGKYLATLDQRLTKIGGVAGQNPYTDQLWSRGSEQLRESMREAAQGWEAQSRVAYRTQSLSDNMNALLPVLRAHPEQFDQIHGQLIDQINAIPSKEPGQKIEWARNVARATTEATAMGVADQSPGYVYRELTSPNGTKDQQLARLIDPTARHQVQQYALEKWEKGEGDRIGAIYASQGPAAGGAAYASIDKLDAPDQVKDAIRRQVQTVRAQVMAERQQQYGGEIMQLHEAISSGDPPPSTRGLVYSLYNRGALPASQAGAMLGDIDRAERKKVEDNVGLELVQESFANPGKAPLDPGDRDQMKDLEQWFDATAKRIGVAEGSQPWINFGLQTTANTGAVPPNLGGWIRSMLVGANADPAGQAKAADAVERIRDTNARAANYFHDDPRLLAMSEDITRLTKAGFPAVDAVREAHEKEARLPDDQKKRDEIWRNARVFAGSSDAALDAVLTAHLGDVKEFREPHWYGAGFVGAERPSAMLADYYNATRYFFEHNGNDAKAAETSAARLMGESWSLTRVNGRPEIMRYAPERMFPGLGVEEIRADLAKAVEQHPDQFRHWDPERHEVVSFKPDPSRVMLAPTPNTKLTAGLSWGLVYEPEDGHQEVIYGANGKPLEHDLPVRRQDYAAARQAAHDAKVKAADARAAERDKAEAGMRELLRKDEERELALTGAGPAQ